ncbi:MAG: MotA/TolQ/ExbB proton channel family protein [Planctomycetes bacterium]|nr:MotA/TolQ/ExbB proton channel family protein [Planctomycetota bacterium]
MVLLNGLRIGHQSSRRIQIGLAFSMLRQIGTAFTSLGILVLLGALAAAVQPPAAGSDSGASQPSVAQPTSVPPNAATPNAVPVASPPKDSGAADDTLFEIIFSGGILGIGIMLALILMSIVAMYLIVDQMLSLKRKDLIPADLSENVRQLLSQGKLKDADQACRERPCPLSFVLISGIAEIEFGWPAVEKALEDSLGEQAARLYRKLEYLSVIGNLAPMLGLLGTVAGMIIAFREVALSQGTAGAGQLASGIYSALVTTVAGLLIAIPSLGAFAVFRNRIDEIISEMAYSAQHVFGPIRRRLPGAGAARPSMVPPPRG